MFYVGWVPCLSGQIFFHNLDPGIGDYDRFTSFSRVSDRCSEVMVSAVKDWRDNVDQNKPQQNSYRLVLCGQADQSGTLTGELYVIDRTPPVLEKNHTDYELSRRPFPGKNTYFEMKLIKLLENKPACLSEIERLMLTPSACVIHRIEFKLSGCGLTNFHYLATMNPNGKPVQADQLTISTVTRQAFIFLKECIHVHTHHEKENDCMTELHEKSHSLEQDALNLYGDLKRALSEIRGKYKRAYHSYAGITLYAKSLLKILQEKKWLVDSEVLKREFTYLDNIAVSLELKGLNHPDNKTGVIKEIKSKFKSSTVYFLTILGPALVFLNTASRNENYGIDNQAEMLEVCTPMPGLIENLCKYAYSQSEDYLNGTLAPILKIFILVVVLASFISLLRITGSFWVRGGSFQHKAQLKLRSGAFSHQGLFGNFNYKLVRMLIGFRLWTKTSVHQPLLARYWKMSFPVALLGFALFFLVVGLDRIGNPIPDANIQVVPTLADQI